MERAARVSLIALGLALAIGTPWIAFVEPSIVRPFGCAVAVGAWLGALWRFARPPSLTLSVRGDEVSCVARGSTHRAPLASVRSVEIAKGGNALLICDGDGRIQLAIRELLPSDAAAIAAEVRAFLRTCGAPLGHNAVRSRDVVELPPLAQRQGIRGGGRR